MTHDDIEPTDAEQTEAEEPVIDERELDEMLHGNDPESGLWSAVEHERPPIEITGFHSATRWLWRIVRSNGFSLVVSLLSLMVSLGFLGFVLALGEALLIVPGALLVAVCGVWAAIAWNRWLACAPYVYRLLTSLGENAEMLLGMTVFRVFRLIASRFFRQDHNERR